MPEQKSALLQRMMDKMTREPNVASSLLEETSEQLAAIEEQGQHFNVQRMVREVDRICAWYG